jgi:26S proteasome regulatory subunit N13
MTTAEPLIQFKAGRVEYDENTREATPKRGQGTIKVAKNPDDPMLFSFVWEPRGSHRTVAGPDERDELLLFPGDAQWVHLKQCTTGRVFALKFKSSSQKHLFWMQSPNGGDGVNGLSAEDVRIAEDLQKLFDEVPEDEEEEEEEDVEIQDAEPAPQR